MARPHQTINQLLPRSNISGSLTVVATPIGNFEDIGIRALRILKEVDFVLAENCSVTKKLLAYYDIHTPLCSYRVRSGQDVLIKYLDRLIAGENAALVCDAGTPSVADPGFQFVSRALTEGISVKCIPGASAISAALSVCGWQAGSYTFAGFPPRSRNDREIFFGNITSYPRPVVIFESSAYMVSTMCALRTAFGDNTEIFIGKDLTKTSECQLRSTLGSPDWKIYMSKGGEFVLILR